MKKEHTVGFVAFEPKSCNCMIPSKSVLKRLKYQQENNIDKREEFFEFLRNYICENVATKFIILSNCFYWSVMLHKNIPVPLNIKPKDIDMVWDVLHMLRNGKQLSWLKEHAKYRIIFRKDNKTVEEVDITQ